jgi:hypothetical protein
MHMRRKMFGAILLPLPFAALPVIVVLIGAVFGPKSSEQLVTRDAPTAITFQERVLTESYDEPTGLAKVSSNSQYESLGCGDQDLRSES